MPGTGWTRFGEEGKCPSCKKHKLLNYVWYNKWRKPSRIDLSGASVVHYTHVCEDCFELLDAEQRDARQAAEVRRRQEWEARQCECPKCGAKHPRKT